MNRTLNVTTPLGPEVLRFDGLQGKESLSQLFDFQLTLKSEEKGLSAQAMLGQPVTPTATNAYVGELYVALPAGATKNLPVRVTGTNSSNYSFNVQPETVNVQLTVVSNSATQIDGTNWAVVKSSSANDYVYVQ